MAGDNNPEKKSLRDDILSFRKDIIKLCVMAIPTALVTMGTNWLKDNVFTQPWQAILVIFPIAIIAWFVWKRIRGQQQFKLQSWVLWFFILYVLIFSIAAGTRILDWQRIPVGYEESVPRNWLSLNWAGDWRYWIIEKKPLKEKLLVILMDDEKNRNVMNKRADVMKLIELAKRKQARGIALDFYFKQNTEIDSSFCNTVNEASLNNLKVFVGYNFSEYYGDLHREPIAANLTNCLPLEKQGHLIGYAEWDGKIRSIPLFMRGDKNLPSLSYQFARSIPGFVEPEIGLIKFIPPFKEIIILDYKHLFKNRNEWSILTDSYVLVGERSEDDSFETPYGKLPGVLIHAYTVHTLLNNQIIKHTSVWFNLIIIYLLCFLLTLLVSAGMNIKKLLTLNLLLTATIILVATLLMYFWLLWFEVIYTLVAIWLFLPLLIGLRKITKKD